MRNLRVLRAMMGLSLSYPIFYSLFACPFPIPWVMCHVCPLLACPFRLVRPFVLWLLAFLPPLAGRFFCGWLCPLGLVQEVLGLLRGLRGLMRNPAPALLLLVSSLIAVIALKTPWLPGVSSLLVLITPTLWVIRVLAFAAILILSLFFYRFWCSVCPVGFFLSLFNPLSLFSLRTRPSCTSCSICARCCRPGLNPARGGWDNRPCLRCLECVVSCRRKSLYVTFRFFRGSTLHVAP